ncbi:hypothetical protein L195_g053772 [Trifolium pratense]|uniref:Uncharacterized protein n=1 Tax=Trifolium pratense TaxID=57577 RepID=A0A2K3KCG6_TRIPR|nr:hypothetical protein L195_g053772 [Trifolium pratense]
MADEPNDNVKSLMSLTSTVKETLHHHTVLATYVTVGLLRTTLVMFKCFIIANMLGLTILLPLRRGVLQTTCVMLFNAVISGLVIVYQVTRLCYQIRNRITGAKDPDHIRDVADE